MRGYVYILTNPSMPGIVKIGRTSRSVHGRAGELYQTGVPTPFEVAHHVTAPDCVALEKMAHDHLADLRVGADREFFRLEVEDARNTLDDLHREQIEEWLDDFMPDSKVIDSSDVVDMADVSMACRGTDVHPWEFISAIEYLAPEAVIAAVGIWRDRVARRKSIAQEQGLIN